MEIKPPQPPVGVGDRLGLSSAIFAQELTTVISEGGNNSNRILEIEKSNLLKL